jgi:hypothetical protein
MNTSNENKNNAMQTQLKDNNSKQSSNVKIQIEEENEQKTIQERWREEEMMHKIMLLQQEKMNRKMKEDEINSFRGKKPTDAEKKLIDAIVQFCDKKE